MKEPDQKLIWKGLTTEPTVVEYGEECPIEGEDLIPIFDALRSMIGEARKIKLDAEDLGHYKKVLARLEVPFRNNTRTLILTGYEIYWMRKACNFWYTPMKKYDKNHPDFPALEVATKRLNAIKSDLMEHQVEEGHKRQS